MVDISLDPQWSGQYSKKGSLKSGLLSPLTWLKRKILTFIMTREWYKHFMLRWVPFLRSPISREHISMAKIKEGLELCKLGDILVSVDETKLTALVPGVFSHAALVMGLLTDENEKPSLVNVAEMNHNGFEVKRFGVFCSEATRVMILRCKDFDWDYAEAVAEEAYRLGNQSEYDTSFSISSVKALYCSELIYHADTEKRLKVRLDDLLGLGRPYLSPDGLVKGENCEVVWDSQEVDR